MDLNAELGRLKYKPRTIKTYISCIQQLQNYLRDKIIQEITSDDIKEYISFMQKRKKAAVATIRQNVAAFDVVFNKIFNLNLDILELQLPQDERKIPVLLTEIEILDLIANVKEKRAKLLIAIMYGCGLELSEALQIKTKDLDDKNNRIYYTNSNGDRVSAIWPTTLKDELLEYVATEKPGQYLFEGNRGKLHYSTDAVQKNFKRTLESLNITKDVSVRTLKYCYVKHLEKQGVPLSIILDNLKLGKQSYSFYGNMDVKKVEILHSPLDRIGFGYNGHVNITPVLLLVNKINSYDEKDYLLEAIKCYESNSYRAAVVMTWIAAMENIQTRIKTMELKIINMAMLRMNPKHKDANTYDEVFEYKERNQILLAQDLGIFDKNQASQLISCLDFRNKCGHPSNYKPQSLKVASFIEDIVSLLY